MCRGAHSPNKRWKITQAARVYRLSYGGYLLFIQILVSLSRAKLALPKLRQLLIVSGSYADAVRQLTVGVQH